jgi:Helix-turn-helix domain
MLISAWHRVAVDDDERVLVGLLALGGREDCDYWVVRRQRAKTVGSCVWISGPRRGRFLTSCRGAFVSSRLAADFGERQMRGLRREEVAALAGVSVHYYTRLERGDLAGASTSVLDALARVMLLTDAEREQ